MKTLKKIMLISLLLILSCGAIFAKGKKDKEEVKPSEAVEQETSNEDFDPAYAK